jgi:hypothetical protein
MIVSKQLYAPMNIEGPILYHRTIFKKWTRRASLREGFSGRRAIPYSKVVGLCRQTHKHWGYSATPPSASLYGERITYND